MKYKVAVAGLLLLISVCAVAQAQMLQPAVKANIPFSFQVGNKVLPEGEYQFIQFKESEIKVVSATNQVMANVLTRLAAGIHTTPKDSHIVFDKVGDQLYLSEVWIPGEDGFELRATPEKHQHRIVDAPVK